jgi:hypothetical protein
LYSDDSESESDASGSDSEDSSLEEEDEEVARMGHWKQVESSEDINEDNIPNLIASNLIAPQDLLEWPYSVENIAQDNNQMVQTIDQTYPTYVYDVPKGCERFQGCTFCGGMDGH